MRWLVRLVTPPGGLVLDPFMGSGSTGMAALDEGFRFVGLDRERHYAEIAQARIAHRHETLDDPEPPTPDHLQGHYCERRRRGSAGTPVKDMISKKRSKS